MTGWRIGYAGGPAEVIKAMTKVQSQSTSNPTSIAQVAAQAALEGPQDCIGVMLKAFKERHDHVVERLNANPRDRVSAHRRDLLRRSRGSSRPSSGCPGVSNDLEFAEYLLEKVGVALVPGTAFGLARLCAHLDRHQPDQPGSGRRSHRRRGRLVSPVRAALGTGRLVDGLSDAARLLNPYRA